MRICGCATATGSSETEAAFWERARPARRKAAPPMFAPFKLREMTLANRIVVSPMATYSAVDGTPGDFHLVHYGARARGRRRAGVHRNDLRLADRADHARLHRHVCARACRGVAADHRFRPRPSAAKICLQLGHSGGKGSTQLGWETMDAPLAEGNWPLIAASDVPWSAANQTPRADDPRRHGRGPRPVRRRDADGDRGRVRHGRASRRARLSAVELHHPAAEQARRRIWRQPRQPPALPARSVRGDARGMARRAADVGAHFGHRLGGRRRRHARRGGADRRGLCARPAPT